MNYKELLLGCLAGLVSAGIGIVLVLFLCSNFSFPIGLSNLKAQGIAGKVIALGTLLNLATFFWFLNKNKEFCAYGVLLATCLLTLLTVLI